MFIIGRYELSNININIDRYVFIFLNEFWNTNYISQIWKRMLPTDIEYFKTFSSFSFCLLISDEGLKT